MAEFTLNETRYRTRLLNALDQWALLIRLQPLLPSLWTLDGGLQGGADMGALMDSLQPLLAAGDDEIRFVFRACLSACERQEEGAWVAVTETPAIDTLMKLVMAAVAENFGVLFMMKRPTFRPVQFDGVSYQPATMPDGQDWLFRPLLSVPALCSLRDLQDGTYHVEDVARMNDLLDVQEENRRRIDKAARSKHV